MSRDPITLLYAAELGLEAMQRELAGTLESSCLLDADLNPRRDTLPAEQEDEIANLESDIEMVKRAIAGEQLLLPAAVAPIIHLREAERMTRKALSTVHNGDAARHARAAAAHLVRFAGLATALPLTDPTSGDEA